MQQHYIQYQSSSIFYRCAGNGRPVVLVHGFGEDGEIWNRQVDFLKAHFKLIIPDLPGSGQSAMINSITIENMADTIKAILDKELPESNTPVIMIGHSMGGYITLAFAEKYPDSLKAFGLFSSSAFADSEEKKVARTKSIAFIQRFGAYEFLKTAIPALFLSGQKEPTPSAPHNHDIQKLVEEGKKFTPEALTSYYQAMIARPDRIAVLKTFTGPVLFIIGTHDKAVPFEQSMQQCYLPQQSHVHILRNSAHMGMWEETDKANAALLLFLQGQHN